MIRYPKIKHPEDPEVEELKCTCDSLSVQFAELINDLMAEIEKRNKDDKSKEAKK